MESQGFGILQKSGKLKKETHIFLEGHERKIYVSSEYYNKKEEKQEKTQGSKINSETTGPNRTSLKTLKQRSRILNLNLGISRHHVEKKAQILGPCPKEDQTPNNLINQEEAARSAVQTMLLLIHLTSFDINNGVGAALQNSKRC